MRFNYLKTSLKTAVLATTVLLLGVGLAVGQVGLTAAPTTLITPDGATVPMWGYTCGTAAAGAVGTCAKLNPTATGWSPVVITVPTGSPLTINLTNSLTFANGNTVPTSLVIVGQLGGGLGTTATSTASPDHSQAQATVTWPIVGTGSGTPPPQGPRVQSFSTEVAEGATTALTWSTLRPGTYLLESGTHPSIQGPMGLYGIVVVTTAPVGATAGCAYPGATAAACAVPYSAEIPLLMSEIDPVQNTTVNSAVNTAGFSETMVWSGQPGGCGNPAAGAAYLTCYPPVVNYSPLYYLFNGVAMDKTKAANSLFPTTPATGATGTVLVRLVNAGLHMHVPSIVGAQTTPPVVATGVTAAAVPGFSLIAEDGNPLPGVSRVQSEVFMAPGKTYDVAINAVNVPAAASALPIYDRELSLSANSSVRDAGMLAYIGINGSGLPGVTAFTAVPSAVNDTYNSLVPCAAAPCPAFTVSNFAKGVIANDTNVFSVSVATAPANGTLTLNANGTFSYVPSAAGAVVADSFVYEANGNPAVTATVTLGAQTLEAGTGITVQGQSYTSKLATFISVKAPGLLTGAVDSLGYPLSAVYAGGSLPACPANADPAPPCVAVDPSGGFNAYVTGAGSASFTFAAKNSQGVQSSNTASASITFPTPTGLVVKLIDGQDKTTPIADYRWIIEEDRTFYVDPTKTTNAGGTTIVPTFGTNFHTSYMPVVAAGCVGTLACEQGQSIAGASVVCDGGNGVCRSGSQQTPVDPSQVVLDPTKRYYISVLPGDAGTPFQTANLSSDCAKGSAFASHPENCGHGMGGAPIGFGQTAVTILVQPAPLPPSKLSVFVFEDDFPLNGENDAGGGAIGGGIDGLAANEPGLGHFNITMFDDAGGTGDATGQMTYDMFNQPLSNSLDGTIDPATHQNACPISTVDQNGITGTIVTCPRYEADGITFSPLAGQVLVQNLMPGRYGIVATPAADRIAAGEEWLQTNTLDGQKAHDSFLRVAEPGFFQEFGPAGYHVAIGFANPKIINDRLAAVCNGSSTAVTPPSTGFTCNNTVTGHVTTERMSRTPDERLYGSGDYSSFGFTQCYVSFGDPDGADFAFTKCDANGNFTISGLPQGNWRVTVFDQWNDMLVDGLSTPVGLSGGATVQVGDNGEVATSQWQANIVTKTFFDTRKAGVPLDTDPGLALVATNIRFRDGSYSNFNNTDLNGNAGFNEVFPLFSWYVVETDTTRYKSTGTHVVYDAGGPADGSSACGAAGYPPCGTGGFATNMANTAEQVPLPNALRVPGAVYCTTSDCTGTDTLVGHPNGGGTGGSTGRVDPSWVQMEGWQGFSGQNSFIEFGKTEFAPTENGGIHGEVIYASTRPFDDPSLLIHTSWTPDVPGVTINLYQEGTAPDGVTQTLKLVDTTKTSSWDDWAQGFRSDGNPNMNCPGQTTADLFYFTLLNQPMYLDVYNNGGTPAHTIPDNSQYKCYDGLHTWNQVQPAPYDGAYAFPSIAGRDPATGKPVGGTGTVTGSNCSACVANPTDGTPMLPAGKYVVEMIVPPGYELVKEEDKNILIGDNYIAPATVEFPGLAGSVYILPDQAEIAAYYNANNPENPTTNLGSVTFPRHEGDTGSIETFWPCVGAARVVPDFISLFPNSAEVAPFAGATRNLCDRKEITLNNQEAELAKFWVFTSTHVAAHFTGVITDDFTSEFDPFSPQFGEKFSPPNMPIAIKDWSGAEISRVYSDQWGTYDGLTYSTWEVNPPNPTGYAPTMMVTCMNDPGTGPTPDPLYNPQYSQFCYEIPFMPGQTQYMDTPVVPTSAFAGAGYNNPDCAYPDATPAIKEVDGDGVGPWVAASGTTHTLTITALGDQTVPNNAYSGPSATTAPYNQKTITRHYGFGSTAGTVALVGANGTSVPAPVTGWSDTQITVTVPGGVPACSMQQQAQYSGSVSTALCGQLVITAANGKQSIDAITVTIGGKAPTHVAASGTIQAAIDAAKPGDLIIVDPTCTTTSGTTVSQVACSTAGATKTASSHQELLLMWKPLRLQGVGAAASIINANTHPAGKLEPWRRQVNCLFGLAIDGTPIANHTGTNKYDPTNTYTCPNTENFQVDRLPLEATVGWDASLNGNLAEQLQEPSLMGAYEGAAITVLGKGVVFPSGTDPYGADTFPVGTLLLNGTNNNTRGCGANSTNARNPFPSNFLCNPSSIDGLGITDSSQGGGGVFVHAWGHNLQIANNRIYNNSGTLSGGISVGQGEFPGQYLRNAATPNADPGSCMDNGSIGPTNTQEPYCFNLNVNVNHNMVALNSSLGDELFSSTPSGAGGVAFCTGADFYKFQYNWVCGNLSTGDGGGVSHMGFSYNGDIEHNQFLFNQSTNPTVPTNGGGLAVLGAPDTDPVCGVEPDQDCPPGTSDGTGPNMVINANLFMSNSADSGTGGAMRLHGVNGTDLTFFPNNPGRWNSVKVTNNIIANNVSGWDGAGISLQDAIAVNIVNNTIIANDSTGSAGILFNTLGAPLSSSPGTSCTNTAGTASCPQPAGIVAIRHSPTLMTNLSGVTLNCPNNGSAVGAHPNCGQVSYPLLDNNVIWQNRSYYIGVGNVIDPAHQQHLVTLFNAFGSTPAPSQPQADATTPNGAGTIITGGSGACTTASYWDIGVRGDNGPSNHGSGFTLAPTYTVITDVADYSAATLHNTGSNPTVAQQYCNGSRVPPELGAAGWQVPPGISDATVPNPVFNLTPAATVDEGNNWVNMSWGPLAENHPVLGTPLGNYVPTSSSSSINLVPASANAFGFAPNTDYFGTQRKGNGFVDAGAVEFTGVGTGPVVTLTAATTATFTTVNLPVTAATAQTLDFHLSNAGPGAFAVGAITVGAAPFSRVAIGTFPAGFPNCGGNLAMGAACTIRVRFLPTAPGTFTGSVAVTGNATVINSPLTISGTAIQGALTFTLGATTGTTANISFTPILTGGILNFGTQVNPSTDTAALTVTNSGTAPVTFPAAPGDTVAGARFAKGADTCQGTTLAPGASCSITVNFSPNSAALRVGLLTVRDNANGNPQLIVLTGN